MAGDNETRDDPEFWIDHLLDDLDGTIRSLRMRRRRKAKKAVIQTVHEFVRQHGSVFTPAPRPRGKGLRRGKRRQCFRNCIKAVVDHEDLIYVEGFALSPDTEILIEHAWCSDDSGKAYELTWTQPGRAYFGVPFNREYVHEHWLRNALLGYWVRIIRHEDDGFHPRRGSKWKWPQPKARNTSSGKKK